MVFNLIFLWTAWKSRFNQNDVLSFEHLRFRQCIIKGRSQVEIFWFMWIFFGWIIANFHFYSPYSEIMQLIKTKCQKIAESFNCKRIRYEISFRCSSLSMRSIHLPVAQQTPLHHKVSCGAHTVRSKHQNLTNIENV